VCQQDESAVKIRFNLGNISFRGMHNIKKAATVERGNAMDVSLFFTLTATDFPSREIT